MTGLGSGGMVWVYIYGRWEADGVEKELEEENESI